MGILFGLLSSLVLLHGNVSAANEIKDRTSWKADDSIVNFKEDYNLSTSITIVIIPKKWQTATSELDVREFAYYFATRSKIGDLPFHYIVMADGNIFVGNKYGDEAKITLSDKTASIFIGYIPQDTEHISITSVPALKSILLTVANKYGISPDTIKVQELAYTLGEKGEMNNIQLENPQGSFISDVGVIVESVKKEYAPQPKQYNVQLIQVTVPQEEYEPAKPVEMKIKLKNTGNFNIYGSTASNLFVTSNNPFDQKSLFYLASDWISPSRIALLKDGERFVVGEEKEFTFKVNTPLYPPEKSQDFILVDPANNKIQGTDFKVTLKIKKGSAIIIEITETPVGYLNVRKIAGNGEVLTKVSPGDRFLVLEINDGYYKIDANGKTGWIVAMYAKVVSRP
jgi:hypothetical protein